MFQTTEKKKKPLKLLGFPAFSMVFALARPTGFEPVLFLCVPMDDRFLTAI